MTKYLYFPITLFTHNIGTPCVLTILNPKFERPLDLFRKLLDEWQTMYTQIRCYVLWHLVWVYLVCSGLSVWILRVNTLLKLVKQIMKITFSYAPTIRRKVERAYSITLVSVCVRDGVSSLHLCFSGISTLGLSFSFGSISVLWTYF